MSTALKAGCPSFRLSREREREEPWTVRKPRVIFGYVSPILRASNTREGWVPGGSLQGRAARLSGCGKTRFARASCQGTTSVVPISHLFSLSGAGFSRRQTFIGDFFRSLYGGGHGGGLGGRDGGFPGGRYRRHPCSFTDTLW